MLSPQLSLVYRQAACTDPRGLKATRQQTGASTPIKPEFEEDVREVDVPGRRARNRFAAA
jgi:hypothetical protein